MRRSRLAGRSLLSHRCGLPPAPARIVLCEKTEAVAARAMHCRGFAEVSSRDSFTSESSLCENTLPNETPSLRAASFVIVPSYHPPVMRVTQPLTQLGIRDIAHSAFVHPQGRPGTSEEGLVRVALRENSGQRSGARELRLRGQKEAKLTFLSARTRFAPPAVGLRALRSTRASQSRRCRPLCGGGTRSPLRAACQSLREVRAARRSRLRCVALS